jgi:TonB-dependent SusC/RagA subfamily outer membrane receptor
MITVSGKVLSKENKPVAGATLYIDNVKTTYKTNSKGTYKIKVSPSALNLEARSGKYGTCEILINGQTTINFTLNGVVDEQTLSEETAANETGISDRGDKPKARKMNTYSNIYQMIRGEVSGVIVSGRSIQIQQGHSFFGSSTPLFVVNGVIVQSIDNINPVEVKSIKVLKGSSAAIYGVNGSNGVLSITLKDGNVAGE